MLVCGCLQRVSDRQDLGEREHMRHGRNRGATTTVTEFPVSLGEKSREQRLAEATAARRGCVARPTLEKKRVQASKF